MVVEEGGEADGDAAVVNATAADGVDFAVDVLVVLRLLGFPGEVLVGGELGESFGWQP